jgi:hypothetical protein
MININRKFGYPIKVFTLTALIFLIGCSSTEVAGTGSQAGNGIVTATVIYDDNSTASSAEIYVRRADYLKDENDTTEEEYVDLTGDDGSLKLTLDSDIDYVVEVRDGNGFAVLAVCSTGAYIGDTLNLDTILIEKEATFSGEVDISGIPDSVLVYVQIYGIDKLAKVDSLGAFHFENIPSGSYELKIKPADPLFMPADSQRIALGPDDSLEAGIFLLPEDFWKDTVIIREILDLNNLDTLAVDSVVKRGSQGRITDLIIVGKGVDTLPPSIGQLRLDFLALSDNDISTIPEEIRHMLSLEQLDLAKNSISVLPMGMMELRNLRFLDLNDNSLTLLPPDFGKLRFLEQFSCRENALVSFNPSIGMLKYLKVLDLYNNEINLLPFEITFLKGIEILDVRYNNLLLLSPEIEEWIDANSNTSEWRATQSD